MLRPALPTDSDQNTAQAGPYYTTPTRVVYRPVKPQRGGDVPAMQRGLPETADDVVRQRFLARRAGANLRWWFNLATFAAIGGAMCGIAQSERLLVSRGVSDESSEGLKWIILLSSMIGVAAMIEYGTWSIKLRRAQGDFVPEGERYYLSLLRCELYGEVASFIFILCLIPLPSINFAINVWDATYSSDACAVLLMLLLRLAFIAKFLVINDPLYSPRNQPYARGCNVALSWRFVLVVRLRESLPHVVGIWMLLACTMAYCITLAERPQDGWQTLKDSDSLLGVYQNSLWLTVATVTTVGHGDMYPRTALGSLLAASTCVLAIFLVTCLFNLVLTAVPLDDSSKRVAALTALVRQNTAVRRQAARCIERLYLLSPIYRRLHPDIGALGRRLKFRDKVAVRALKHACKNADEMCGGPLSDAVLLRELCALRVLRERLASLQRQVMHHPDTIMREVVHSSRTMLLQVQMLVDKVEHSLQRIASLDHRYKDGVE